MRGRKRLPRKKRCPCCGRVLPAEAFGVRHGICLRAYCRECENGKRRTGYSSRAKYAIGEVVRKEDGLLWQYTGGRWRRYWSPSMIETLRSRFPTTEEKELAWDFDVSVSTLRRKARELGLRKSKAYRAEVSRRHLRYAIAASNINGNSGWFKKGNVKGKSPQCAGSI